MGLSQTLDKAVRRPLKRVDIDISEFTGEPAGTDVLTFEELTTAQVFQQAEDARQVSQRFPLWSETLCLSVAGLALSHVAPAEESETPIGLVYCKLADDPERRELWLYLVSKWNEAFPSLTNLMQKIDAEKNAHGHPVQPDDAVHRASAPDARRADGAAGLGDGAAPGVAAAAPEDAAGLADFWGVELAGDA